MVQFENSTPLHRINTPQISTHSQCDYEAGWNRSPFLMQSRMDPGGTRSAVILLGIPAGFVAVIASLTWVEAGYPEVYAVARDWQTFIAGLVGFGGLAWVTYQSAILADRRDRRLSEIAAQDKRESRTEKAASFAAVVTWEVALAAQQVVTVRKLLTAAVQREPDEDLPRVAIQSLKSLSSLPSARFFEDSSDNVILLPSELVGKVCEFYYDLADVIRLWERVSTRDEVIEFADRLRLTVELGNSAILSARAETGPRHKMPEAFDLTP